MTEAFPEIGYPEITHFNQWECPLETINFGVPPFTEIPEGSTVASDGILICHEVLPTWDCHKAGYQDPLPYQGSGT